MAHKKLENGRVVVDWETGDNEGDRKHIMSAYQDFIKELIDEANKIDYIEGATHPLEIIKKWNISIENQVDDFPRIWIKRP
jgi:predicted DNA-binding transcriptional regulator